MTPWQRFGALCVLAAGALYLTRPKGTVTTSEEFDLMDDGATSYPYRLKEFAQAIARAEGFYVSGSVPQRANNPGNLKLPGSRTLSSGQTSGITVFDSVDLGWTALYKQLQLIVNGRSAHYHLDMTIDDMGAVYEADPGNAWARNVSTFLGVTPETRLWEVLV